MLTWKPPRQYDNDDREVDNDDGEDDTDNGEDDNDTQSQVIAKQQINDQHYAA